MNKLLLLSLLVPLLLFSGCNRKIGDLFSRTPSRLVVNEVNFDYLSAKAKISFSGDKKLSGVANFRVKKDSIIWISLSPGLGVEVARAMITRDSIMFMDKINHKYTSMGFEELSEKFDFNINYKLIESVIFGNLIFPYDREKVVRMDNLYAYNQRQGSFYFQNFIGSRTMKLEKLQVEDTLSKNSISVNYGDFQLVEEEIFPFRIMALLHYKDQVKPSTTIEIEFNKADIEKKPLKFPFNVPQRYERK